NPVLRTRHPIGACKAFQDWMLALDAAVISISVGADDVSGFADAQQFREPEFGAWLKVLVVQAGFEPRHGRSAGVHVGAELLALAIAQNGDVGQQQRAVFTDPFQIEPVFVHEVERKAAAEKSLVHAVRRLPPIGLCVSHCTTLVKKLRALSDHDADVREEAAWLEMSIVFLRPLKVLGADALPATIFSEACF